MVLIPIITKTLGLAIGSAKVIGGLSGTQKIAFVTPEAIVVCDNKSLGKVE